MAEHGRRRVFLHVGAPKTGTTYLQEILWRNQDALRRGGVLYPGDRPEQHFQAAMDLQGGQFQDDWFDENVPRAWDRLVEQSRTWPGDVVLSHELFSTTQPADVERAMSDLDFAEVNLVCTARDLARQIPAAWQEDVKNRHTVSYAEFSAGVRGGPDARHWLSELFWQRQDLPAILRKWSAGVSPERVHVVTVPPPGHPRERLWRRFAGMLGIDPSSFDSRAGRSNQSLGVAETELIGRLNRTLDGRLDWPGYDSVMKHRLSDEVLGDRPARRPLGLPDADRAWVFDRAERMVDELAATDYRVVGDLDELLPRTGAGSFDHPDDAADREVLDVAVEALAGFAEHQAELERALAERDELLASRASVRVRRLLAGACSRYPVLAPARALYRRSRDVLGGLRRAVG